MKIKEKLVKAAKNMIPLELLFSMKYRSKLRQKKELNIPTENYRIFLLDSPHYGNIGDQAIAYAIQKFAHTYFTDYSFVDIQQEELAHYLDELKKHGFTFTEAVMVGGPSRSPVWPGIVAETTGLKLTTGGKSAGALGAAILCSK